MSEDPERTDGLGPAREPEPPDAQGPPRGWKRLRDLMGDQPSLAIIVVLLAGGALALAIFGLVRILGVDSSSDRATGDSSSSVSAVDVEDIVGGSNEDADGSDGSMSTASGDGTADDGTSGPGGSDDGDEGEASGPGGATGDVAGDEADAGLVAYRMEGQVWIANVDGTDPRPVADLLDGVYALSPDGAKLAVVDSAVRRLRVVDLATGEEADVGPAFSQAPDWSADSRWFVYTLRTTSSYELKTAGRDGGDIQAVSEGHSGRAAAADVAGFVAGGAPGSAGLLTKVARGEAPTPIEGADDVAEFDWSDGGFSYVCAGPECPLTAIRFGTEEDPEGTEIVGPPSEVAKPGRYASLAVSPDGEWLAFTLGGDDGFSRLWVVRKDGTDPRELSVRRDAYPLRWTPDAEYVLFIEGNAIHGEETRLMRVRPDGTGRMELVPNAGL